jgi:hypothetical protein
MISLRLPGRRARSLSMSLDGIRHVELYGVRSFAAVDRQRDRMILGESLRPIDEAPWRDCLLYNTGLVPEPVFA